MEESKDQPQKVYLTRKNTKANIVTLPEFKSKRTPKGNSQKNSSKKSIAKQKKNLMSKRKFFKAREDAQILKAWRKDRGTKSSRAISDSLAERLEHTSESIRDRVKRYISKLSQFDEKYLIEQAKEYPTHYVHFKLDKSKNRKAISHISSVEPKIAGSKLTQKERRAIKREHSRKKNRIIKSAKSTPGKNSKILTSQILAQVKKKQLEQFQENSETYRRKLRKRTPPKYDSPPELSPLRPISTKKMAPRSRKSKRVSLSQENENSKLETFLEQLNSIDNQDVECNAEILAEIIKSFAVTFSLEIQDIVELITDQAEGNLNMEDIRMKLFQFQKK